MKVLLKIVLVCLVLANAGCATTSRSQSESDTAVSINNQGCDYDRSGDYYNAYLNFKKSADMGYSLAKYNLAVLYWKGRYVQKDPHTAGRYFLEAAQAGLPAAMHAYGLYLWNYGIKQQNDPAVSWIQNAASHGDQYAINFLQWLSNADSITQMGYNYFQTGDYYNSYVNYKKAADMGYYFAKYNLGVLYWNGYYVQKDPHTAGRYWLEAAQAGFPTSMAYYGLYLFMYGNTQDQQIAASWIQTAASHGEKNASMFLQDLHNGQLQNKIHQAYQAAQQTRQYTVSAPAPSNTGRRKQRHHAEPSSPPSYMPSKRSDNAGSKNAPSVQDVEKF